MVLLKCSFSISPDRHHIVVIHFSTVYIDLMIAISFSHCIRVILHGIAMSSQSRIFNLTEIQSLCRLKPHIFTFTFHHYFIEYTTHIHIYISVLYFVIFIFFFRFLFRLQLIHMASYIHIYIYRLIHVRVSMSFQSSHLKSKEKKTTYVKNFWLESI